MYKRQVLEGVLRLVIFLGYIALISRMEDIQRVFQYLSLIHIYIGSSYLLEGIDENGNIREESKDMVMNDLRAHFLSLIHI